MPDRLTDLIAEGRAKLAAAVAEDQQPVVLHAEGDTDATTDLLVWSGNNLPDLLDGLARARRAAETLGTIVDRQCRAALDATGLHHLIDADGDGDWGLVWERLAEMGARVTELEAQADRVRQVHQPIEALNMRHHPNGRLTRVCSGCGTDDGNWQHYPCPTIRALEETR